SGEERRRAVGLAGRLSVAILARAWQLLLKGLDELTRAPNQAAAAEMVLIRLAYTADLPSPADIIGALGGNAPRAGSKPALAPAEKRPAIGAPVDALETAGDEDGAPEDDIGPADPVSADAPPMVRTFADVLAQAGVRREAKLK